MLLAGFQFVACVCGTWMCCRSSVFHQKTIRQSKGQESQQLCLSMRKLGTFLYSRRGRGGGSGQMVQERFKTRVLYTKRKRENERGFVELNERIIGKIPSYFLSLTLTRPLSLWALKICMCEPPELTDGMETEGRRARSTLTTCSFDETHTHTHKRRVECILGNNSTRRRKRACLSKCIWLIE